MVYMTHAAVRFMCQGKGRQPEIAECDGVEGL